MAANEPQISASPDQGHGKKFPTVQIIAIAAAVLALGVSGYFYLTSGKGPFGPLPEARGAKSEKLPFPERMASIRANLKWKDGAGGKKLNRKILLQSLELGRKYLMANQKPEGNFNYQYDFVTRKLDKDDNQVRQAGALWGVALIYLADPREDTLAALNRGFDFFFANTKEIEGRKFIAYPGDKNCETGAVALVALSIIETLRAPQALAPERILELNRNLDGYLAFLRSLQLDDGRFAMSFNIWLKTRVPASSPYFDGETLLALCKAARYLDRTDLLPVIEKAAGAMAKIYTVDAWKKDGDSDKTKGFYQWGSMAFREYTEAGWKDAELYKDVTLTLAWWMLHTHRILKRGRNTGYAYEGLVSAYAVAKDRQDVRAAGELASAVDRGLEKLTSWQVGGPLMKRNDFLQHHPTADPLALGGVLNEKSQPALRIDVTQHQMHAVLLALETIYIP